MKRDFYRSGTALFAWMLLAGPVLVLGGHYLWDIPGALIGAGILFAGYYWRYWIYITKMKLVWEEEETAREQARSKTA